MNSKITPTRYKLCKIRTFHLFKLGTNFLVQLEPCNVREFWLQKLDINPRCRYKKTYMEKANSYWITSPHTISRCDPEQTWKFQLCSSPLFLQTSTCSLRIASPGEQINYRMGVHVLPFALEHNWTYYSSSCATASWKGEGLSARLTLEIPTRRMFTWMTQNLWNSNFCVNKCKWTPSQVAN